MNINGCGNCWDLKWDGQMENYYCGITNLVEDKCPQPDKASKWLPHKGPFEHIGNNVMKCPRCGLEGKDDVFGQVSCIEDN